ncbi:MAG: hypothetical protein ABMA64_02890 [Myxococcota bacterium]
MILLSFAACAADPTAPAPVTYDHEACDACAMLISEPRFAAQLVTREGDRRFFDDPACLFGYVVEHHPTLSNVWFRDSTSAEEEWLPWSAVGFVPATGAPMAGGFAAVPAGTADAVSFGEASNRVLSARAR